MKQITAKKGQLNKAFKAYNDRLDEMLEMVKEKLTDDFLEDGGPSIQYQDGDGFVLEFQANNARLIECIGVIETKGVLSYEDYIELTI